ncbi:MAG: hypothetical protein QM484_14415 [Woeseiaceae bacterium]
MEELNSEDLFQQIRAAHRMVVAYYKRLFPKIQGVADKLNLNFYYWAPTHFNRPARGSTNILLDKSWEWDLVPGVIANYFFLSSNESNKQRSGDWMLEFHVITDTGVSDENRVLNQDPLELLIPVDKAESVLCVHIWVSTKDNTLNWYNDVWASCDHSTISDQPSVECLDEDNNIYGSCFEISLTELVKVDVVENISRRIEKYKEYILLNHTKI